MNLAKLKQNAFWMGCGAAILILGILYLLVYQPRASELDKMMRQIKESEYQLHQIADGIRSPADAQEWIKHRDEGVKKLQDLITFYKSRDADFEKWSPALNVQPTGSPNHADFVNVLESEQNLLDKQIPLATPDAFKWERVKADQLAAIPDMIQRTEVMRDLQKAYWTRSRLAPVIDKIAKNDGELPPGTPNLTQLVEVRWLYSVYDKWKMYIPRPPPDQYPSGGQEMRRLYSGVPGPEEFKVPGDLAASRTFGITLRLKLGEVPNFISGFLDPSLQPKIFIELLGVKIEPAEQNPPVHTIKVPKHLDDAAKLAAIQKAYKDLKSTPVILRMTSRILDFSATQLDARSADINKAKPGGSQ